MYIQHNLDLCFVLPVCVVYYVQPWWGPEVSSWPEHIASPPQAWISEDCIAQSVENRADLENFRQARREVGDRWQASLLPLAEHVFHMSLDRH
jgi:hypothetical protein